VIDTGWPIITLDAPLVGSLGVALGAGLLVGVEREQRKSEHPRSAAGIRTFTLIALAGAICALFGVVMLATGAAFVALAALASFRRTYRDDPGLTTEVAMVVVYLLGALAMRAPVLAASLAVVVALLLAMKTHLHLVSRDILSEQELRDGLLLLASALVVLPMLPDHAVDPWQVLNPHRVWRVVVLIMAINALGYVAQRMFGPKLGLPLSGLVGGFVSSTATIGAMGQRAKATPSQMAASVAAAALSNIATVIQLALLLLALSPSLLRVLLLPLVVAGLATASVASISVIAAWRTPQGEVTDLRGRPFEPKHALIFAALLTGILLGAAMLSDWFGDRGVLLAAGLAGFADAHAAAASVAQVFASGRLDLHEAEWAVLVGLATNTASKLLVARATGGAAFAIRLLPSLIALLAGFTILLLWAKA